MSVERPILMSAPMVRAILDGSKTQTRRMMPKTLHDERIAWKHEGGAVWKPVASRNGVDMQYASTWPLTVVCPYGQPGDRLWVREAICYTGDYVTAGGETVQRSRYVADNLHTKADAWPWKRKTLPSMFLPRGLSRIALEITGVRVERLQGISEEDAKAEGVDPYVVGHGPVTRGSYHAETGDSVFAPMVFRHGFQVLWNSINGSAAWWALNPWVWVVEFKRVHT